MGLLFFTPIIIAYVVLELLVLNIPTNYSIIGDYLDKNQNEIEVAIFGSSQIKNAINPVFLDNASINLSSTMQHQNTDYKLLSQTRNKLKNLETVVFEVSYSHFEVGHNSKYYWKSNVFLKYYNVNLQNRNTYPTDSLLYLSHPGYFSRLLIGHYFTNNKDINFNKFGFDENKYKGKYLTLKYDSVAIANSYVKINKRANRKLFDYNVAFFYDMLDYCENEGLNVVIISPPTHYNYNNLRNPLILNRRDSIFTDISKKYKNVYFLNSEEDKDFTAKKFWNENHLNPDGAKIFTLKLNEVINNIDN